jgi:hypothetical protein
MGDYHNNLGRLLLTKTEEKKNFFPFRKILCLLLVINNPEYSENHDLKKQIYNFFLYENKKSYVHYDNQHYKLNNSMDHNKNTFHNLRQRCNVLNSRN